MLMTLHLRMSIKYPKANWVDWLLVLVYLQITGDTIANWNGNVFVNYNSALTQEVVSVKNVDSLLMFNDGIGL